MTLTTTHRRAELLFLVLLAFFLTNALLAEFIGVKLFSLERTLGHEPLQIRLFSDEALGFNLTAGVLLWPFVFILTDLINEYFGRAGVRIASYLAAGLICYAFLMVVGAIHLHPADFWTTDPATGLNLQAAYSRIFGQGLWIIIGSLTAFLIGQFVDVYTFHFVRRLTGSRHIWLRATGSTLVSQLIDSFVVLFIAFYLPESSDWSLARVFSVGLVNYAYKFTMALALTPALYAAHAAIDRYLGQDLAKELMERATLR